MQTTEGQKKYALSVTDVANFFLFFRFNKEDEKQKDQIRRLSLALSSSTTATVASAKSDVPSVTFKCC